MARVLRRTDKSVSALADSVNDLKDYVMEQMRLIKADDAGDVVTGFHNDQCELAITAATAEDLPGAILMVNQARAVYEFHRKDLLAHKAVDATNAVAAPAASNLATAITLANEIKADYNAHRQSTDFHYTADSTNNVAASTATDLDSLLTMVNELKTDINAHIAGGPACKSIRAVGA